MTFVNWPDKDLRPVADSDIQRIRKKSVPNWSASVRPDADIWTRSLIVKQISSLNQSEIKGSVKIISN